MNIYIIIVYVCVCVFNMYAQTRNDIIIRLSDYKKYTILLTKLILFEKMYDIFILYHSYIINDF